MTTQLPMFLANRFSRICSAHAQFVIVVANQHASYLFSTCTIRAVLVLRFANQLNSGQSKSEPVWCVENYLCHRLPNGQACIGRVCRHSVGCFFHNGKLQTEMFFLSDRNRQRQCETKTFRNKVIRYFHRYPCSW